MGYLFDNIPPGQNYVLCPDLYLYKIIVRPAFRSDRELMEIIEDELPDVEEWQYCGRRRRPVAPPPGGRRVRRQVHPAAFAQDSRHVRPFTEIVRFAFHTVDQRAQVMARFNQELIKYTIENEPGAP